ncbi:MAG: xylulokinase [Treponema sp.]|nr:xylulokinase [Treponema sp.]
MKTVCGIDLGTQSCKIVLYDYIKKKIVETSQEPLDLISGNDGSREQKTEWYANALKASFAKLSKTGRKSIIAIGVSGQQHGFVPLDRTGKALYNIKLWCDTSTQEECEELTKAAGGEEELIKTVGFPMRVGYTAPKILRLKKHKPKAFAKLAHILLPHDYINFLLTGNYTAEYGDASGTVLFDVKERLWSKKVCDLIDPLVYKCLPPLIPPGKPAGTVSGSAAAEYGIPEGALVAPGGGDNMMAAIGTGTVKDGFLAMSLGTSGTLFGFSKTPVIDPKGDLGAFCSSTGGWLPLLCTMNCTVATEEIRRIFNLDLKSFNALAEKATIGAEGISILPFFNGERTPNLPNGRASINGITSVNFSKQNLARAALESAIFGMKMGLKAFNDLGFKAKEIRLTGGGSKSRLWQSIASNVMNLPVRVPQTSEAAALGSAIQALWVLEGGEKPIEEYTDKHISLEGGDIIKPDPKTVKEYDKAYLEYSRYLNALETLYK